MTDLIQGIVFPLLNNMPAPLKPFVGTIIVFVVLMFVIWVAGALLRALFRG